MAGTDRRDILVGVMVLSLHLSYSHVHTHAHTCTHTSLFLLARKADSEDLVGFVSFRFDLDDGIEVLYW